MLREGRPFGFPFKAAAAATVLVLVLMGWRPGYHAWQLRAVRHQLNLGSIADAREALLQLSALERATVRASPDLLFLRGRAARRAGHFDEAMSYLQKAESAGWDREQIAFQRQLAVMQSGRINVGDDSFDRLMRRDSSDAAAYEIYEALAKGYLASYRFADAIHCLDFWTGWCPNATDPRVWRAGIYEQTDRWEDANEEYRQVLKIDPAHADARLALSRNLLMEQNRPADAYAEFQTCLMHSPGDFNAMLGCASCERQLGEPAAAEKKLRELLGRSLTQQERANVQTELGLLLIDRGELTEAAQVLEEVTQADPLNGSAFYSLGTVWSGLGQKERAVECFDRSKALTEQFGRLTAITTELANNPEQPDLRWEAGRILMDQGMHVEGARWMATALIYDPNHRATHLALAEYYETFKPDEALARRHRDMASGVGDTEVN